MKGKFIYFFGVRVVVFFLGIFGLISCENLVNIDPPYTSVSGENVFIDDASATAVLTGLYAQISRIGIGGSMGSSMLCGLAADELTLWGGVTYTNHLAYYENALSVIDNTGTNYWDFNNIYRCNAAIAGLTESNSLSPTVKRQLIGEARFLRAYFYFYLTNYFGDIPLMLTTDYRVNSLIRRSPEEAVFGQIITDLKEAQELLNTHYLNGNLQPYGSSGTERVRPTFWVATALLARTYLYIGDFASAEIEATKVINNTSLFGLQSLNEVFSKNNQEAIWQLQPVAFGRNSEDARVFVIPATGPSNSSVASGTPAWLSDGLFNSFEADDQRRVYWIGSVAPANPGTVTYHFPYKYKVATTNAPVTEYQTPFRLGELYLVRAEARAQLNNIDGAQADLNAVRSRAGLGDTPANDQQSLLDAILQERRVELFTEMGHRWFDLKRTGKIDEVMSVVTPLKANGAQWRSHQQRFPIPQSDLDKNPNLTQNAGYD